jgi:glycosyltransferase involved in cell wall biosynthesis
LTWSSIITANKSHLKDAGKSRLRIAVVAPPWFQLPPPGYGGIEWICYWLVEGLVARGHDVTLIGAGEKGVSANFISTYDEPPSARLGEQLLELIHIARAAEILRSGNFDVVHDHTLSGPLLSLAEYGPTVLTAHGPIHPDIAEYYRILFDYVSLVSISVSQREGTPDLPWIGTVLNAIPVEEYTLKKTKEDFVLFLGRMNADKGAHLAIDAARESGHSIVIAAKCNEAPERAYFDTEVKPRMGPDVQWIGEADTATKKDLLARAKCLVFPIQWEEPFGIVMCEAMASGTPVVALRRGSVPEVVTEGETGFICDHPDELADGIRRAEEIDPSVCRAQALARFDLPRMVSGYEQVYQDVIHRSQMGGRLPLPGQQGDQSIKSAAGGAS